MSANVTRRGYHLTRKYSVAPVDILHVGKVMDATVPTIPATMLVTEFAELIAQGNPKFTHRQGTPIVDAQGDLVGIITRGDVLRALNQDGPNGTTVLNAGKRDPVVTIPDELLRDAVDKLIENDIGRLPVVSRENPKKLLGYLDRSGIIEARAGLHEEENVRERVWAIPI